VDGLASTGGVSAPHGTPFAEWKHEKPGSAAATNLSIVTVPAAFRRLFMPHMVSNRVAAFGATAAPPKEQVPMER
jgi:hypothetical protein